MFTIILFFSGQANFTTWWQKSQQTFSLFCELLCNYSCPNAQLELIHYLWLNPTRAASLRQKLLQPQNRVKNAPDDFLPYHANETQVSVLARRHVSPHHYMRSLVEGAKKAVACQAKKPRWISFIKTLDVPIHATFLLYRRECLLPQSTSLLSNA